LVELSTDISLSPLSATAFEQAMSMKKKLFEETGAATAEYVVATMAAVGFATLLVSILKSDQVKQLLFDMVTKALTAAS
jgi:hypothetical protein